MASVYLMHFEHPIGSANHQAQHYIGFAHKLGERWQRHIRGAGACITRWCVLHGIGFAIVRTWGKGTRSLERQLKARKDSASLCPVCRGNRVHGRLAAFVTAPSARPESQDQE